MSLGRPAGPPPGEPSETGSDRAQPRAWAHFVPSPPPSSRTAGLVGDLLATLFPGGCRLCDAPLLRPGRVPVCELCLAAPAPHRGSLCITCGEDLGFEGERAATLAGLSPSATQQCDLCRRLPPPFRRAVAFGTYEHELRALLHLFKYDAVPTLARPLGAMLAQALTRLASDLDPASIEPALLIPVPLAPRKERERGFNQTDLLARAALRHLGPSAPLALAPVGVLRRTRETESQFGLNPRQRRLNLRGAFAPGPTAARLAGRDCVLVDDIFTTGATARACAAVLQQAGARRIFVATLARAQPETVALWDAGST